jgi:hypothetical protein
MDKLKQWGIVREDTCPRCKQQPETYNHVWQCQKTKDKIEEIINETKEIMASRHKESIDWNKLSEPDTEELIAKLDITGIEFLDNPNAKGIITKGTVQKLRSSKKITQQYNEWTLYALDCWLSAFYKMIWTERCEAAEQQQNDQTQNGGRPHRKNPRTTNPKQRNNNKVNATKTNVKRIRLIVNEEANEQDTEQNQKVKHTQPDTAIRTQARKRKTSKNTPGNNETDKNINANPLIIRIPSSLWGEQKRKKEDFSASPEKPRKKKPPDK